MREVEPRSRRTVRYNAASNTYDIQEAPSVIYEIQNDEDKRRTIHTNTGG